MNGNDMLNRIYSCLYLLIWSVLLVSTGWIIEILAFAVYKFLEPEFYFHSWYAPSLVPLFGLVFALIALLITELTLIFAKKKSWSKRMERYFTVNTALIVLFFLLGIYNFRIAFSGYDVSLKTIHSISLGIIIGNLVTIVLFFILLRWLKRISVYIAGLKRRFAFLASSVVVLAFLIYSAIVSLDINQYVFSFSDNENFLGGKDRPNVIMIVIDTQRADYFGCYGSGLGLTPRMDKIAADGLLFNNSYSTCSWTTPSFASLYTSLYPYKIFVLKDRKEISQGIEHKFFFHPVNEIDPALPTLATVLDNNGYETAALQANYHAGRRFNFDLGSDFFLGCYNRTYLSSLLYVSYSTIDQIFSSIFGWEIGKLFGISGAGKREYCAYAENLTDIASNYIDEVKDRPFFLLVNYMDVHEYQERYPVHYSTPAIRESFKNNDLMRFYALNLAYCDAQIGRLYDHLKTTGILDETIFIITADHGEQFDEHGFMGGHGHSVYNEEIRVPLIMRYPPTLPQGEEFNGLTSNIDLFPTLAEMCGISLEEYELDGVNLFADALLPRMLYAGQMQKTMDKNAAISFQSKLIHDFYDDSYEFFELDKDPEEEFPILPDSLTKGMVLHDSLDKWQDEMLTFQFEILDRLEEAGELQIDKAQLKALGYIK